MRIKRHEPSTDAERKRAAELRRTIASSRTSKAGKEAAEQELDTLAPPLTNSAAKEPSPRFGSPKEIKVSKLTNADLEALVERVKDPRESGSSSLVDVNKGSILSEGTPDSSTSQRLARLVPGTFEHDAAIAWCSIPATPEVREAAVKRYWIENRKREDARLLADPVLRRRNAALYVAESTDNPLRTHARKFTDSLIYDLNNMGAWESIAERREYGCTRLLWEVLTWNRSFAHPTTDPKWAADIFAEVDRRDLDDPQWFRRALEKPGPPRSSAVEERVKTEPEPATLKPGIRTVSEKP